MMALDLLRVLQREPQAIAQVLDDIGVTAAGNAPLAAPLARLRAALQNGENVESRAREITEQLAVIAAGSLLQSAAPSAVADAFIATRLASPHQIYGQSLSDFDIGAILSRTLPE